MANKRKLGLTAGTALTLGALVGGCPIETNNPPRFNITETDGTPIRTTQSQSIAEEYGWNEAIVLPINREDIYNGTEDFIVNATDDDGPLALTGNFYPQDSTVGVTVTDGLNLENELNWHVVLSGDNVPRGTFPFLVAEARDGMNNYTVGILGAVSPGGTFPPEEPQPQPPYIIGDGICDSALGEPSTSPDCQTEPPYIIGDGICDSALGEPSTSPDCQTSPPAEPTRIADLPKGSIDMQIYEGSTQLPDVDTANPIPLAPGDVRYLTARLQFTPDAIAKLGTSIDDIVVSAPSITDIMPAGEFNGIYVTNIGQTSNPDVGIYEVPFHFVHSGSSSPQVEDWITASYDLTDPSGTFHFEDRAYFAE